MNIFPPIPVYPDGIDSDYTLFKVYNTSEAPLTSDNSAWASEINIQPVGENELEIWGENGFVNLSGELIYYDAVSKDSNGKIYQLKRCARNLGGNKPKFNPKDTMVRGFVIAEHHNQIVDTTIIIEKFVGTNPCNNLDEQTLFCLLQELENEADCIDDNNCPVVNFEFTINDEEINNCQGISIDYNVSIQGQFTSFRLDFGDGNFSTQLSGTYTYASNASVDPIVTVTNTSCQIIQTPTERANPEEPTAAVTDGPFEIPIPVIPDFPVLNLPDNDLPEQVLTLPQIVFPCFEAGNVAIGPIPSIIQIDPPINIPSTITIDSIDFPSAIEVNIDPVGFPSIIEFGPVDIPSIIEFGEIPSIAPFDIVIDIVSVDFPSIINFGPVDIPTIIEFGPTPEFPSTISFGPVPNFPSVISFGPISPFPTIIDFGPAPNFPTLISFGSLPNIPSVISFGSAPSLTVVWGSPPTPNINWGSPPTVGPIAFGSPPTIPAIAFGSPPSISVTFGSAPTISVGWGSAPEVSVNWGSPPTVSCTVTVECPTSGSFRNANNFDPLNFIDQLETPDIEVNYNDIGIPSEIKILPPDIPDIKVIHDIPTKIKLELEEVSLPSKIKIEGPDSPIPDEIRLIVSKDIPTTISLDTSGLDKTVKLDSSGLPDFIPLKLEELPVFKISISDDLPKLQVEGIPDRIQVDGIPSTITLIGDIPSEIIAKLEIPKDIEIPLVYKGGPIPLKLDLNSEDVGGDEPCFKLVPCMPK